MPNGTKTSKMKKLKLRGREIKELGYAQSPAIGMAIDIAKKHCKHKTKEEVLQELAGLLKDTEAYLGHEYWQPLAERLLDQNKPKRSEIELREQAQHYHTYGASGIDQGALEQMGIAMRLPITQAGALMPDAHPGYGLPIGGVLAAERAVIPYGVGMDIGCRMCLTVYDMPPGFLEAERPQLKELLLEHTRFGISTFDRPFDDEVLARPLFKEIPKLKALRQKARQQIGTSGSGNHFVEFGTVRLSQSDNEFGLPAGDYFGLLSHSGSRGLGANIAQHYTKLAQEQCLLPKEARHLAWLSLDSEAGQEYWQAMNLAGDYASACHAHIHRRMAEALGEQPIMRVENHHNFAWQETAPDGREWIVHRKGATPAGLGVLGIIPGSMTAPGFIVRGKGSAQSLDSAAHGAGRLMSRRQAIAAFTPKSVKQKLKQEGVDLIGGGLDEAPFAYKDIFEVMAAQEDLVDVLGTFWPKIVRMDGN